MKKVVGYVDVDAGIIQVGDPCYTLDGERVYLDKSDRVTITQDALDAIVSMIPNQTILRKAVEEALEKSRETIKHEDRMDGDPGVQYHQMIDRLVDHDDIRLRIGPEQMKRMQEAREEAGVAGAGDRWIPTEATSLAPPPEDRDGVVHSWQPVWNPYKDARGMVGSPHDGAGIVVSSGWGDGSYPVEVEWDDEGEYFAGIPPTTFDFRGETFVSDKGRPPSRMYRVKSVKVTFIGDGDDDEED